MLTVGAVPTSTVVATAPSTADPAGGVPSTGGFKVAQSLTAHVVAGALLEAGAPLEDDGDVLPPPPQAARTRAHEARARVRRMR